LVESKGDFTELVFILFYPLCSLISPIFGLVAMVTCKKRLYQQQSFWNSLSLFTNTLVYTVIRTVSEKYEFIHAIAFILVFTKICLSQLLPLQIAYFNNPKYQKNKEFLRVNYASKLLSDAKRVQDIDVYARDRANGSDHDSDGLSDVQKS